MNTIVIISIAVVIAIIIIIIIARRLHVNQSNSPLLIPTISEGTTEYFFAENQISSPPINGGLEYTFSFWIYISNWSYKYGLEKIIAFWKGQKPAALTSQELEEQCKEVVDDLVYGDTNEESADDFSNNKKPLSIKETCNECDGQDLLEDFSMPTNNNTRLTGILISLGKNNNSLIIRHTLIDGKNATLVVEDLPIQKWLNVTIILQLRNLDVFINGKLKASKKFPTLPTYQKGDLILNPNGGFDGYLSKFQYMNRKITINDVRSIFHKGPKNWNPFSNNKLGRDIGNKLGDIGSNFTNPDIIGQSVKQAARKLTGKKFLLGQLCHTDNDCQGELECLQGKCTFADQTRKLGQACFSNSDCQAGLDCNNHGSQNLSDSQIEDLNKLGIPVKKEMTYNSEMDKKPFTCIYPPQSV